MSPKADTRSLRGSIAAHPLGKLASLSASEFQALCRDMDGAFPDLVREGLSGHVELGIATQTSAKSEFDVKAPEPSPIDFDWRFDERTASRLADVLIGDSNRRVLCVGTPTVYGAITGRGGSAFLIDRNPLLTPNLAPGTFLINDLSTVDGLAALIDCQFDAAIIDPPWYPEAYDLWLSRTLPLLRSRAEVFVIMFRRFTRPRAREERAELLKRFQSFGHVSLARFEAVYSTPRFEQEVLARLGLPFMPTWRAGDIIKIKLHSDPIVSILDPNGWPLERWERFALGDQVIAIREVPTDCGPILIADEFPFEVHSVSQRNPARGHYTVWTSKGKAAVVSGTKRLSAILKKSSELTIEASDIKAAIELSRQLSFQIGGSCA
jgi:Probable N6-adenine methyltransferase